MFFSERMSILFLRWMVTVAKPRERKIRKNRNRYLNISFENNSKNSH